MDNRVKEIRKFRRLLKKDVVAMSDGTITHWRLTSIEAGTGYPPRADEMTMLSAILKTSVDELFPYLVSPSPPPEGTS